MLGREENLVVISDIMIKEATEAPDILPIEKLEDVHQDAEYGDVKSSVFSADYDAATDEVADGEEDGRSTAGIVDALLLSAYRAGCSELHIEPLEKESRVRFRVDGLMRDIAAYPRPVHDRIVARLKAVGRMRADELSAAQDGRLSVVLAGETVDVLIDIVPVIDGEKVVMRLLAESGRRRHLESIGLSEVDMAKVVRALDGRAGLMISAGPAGSGKTATLRALLKALDASEVEATAIEDPIGYDIPGVSQIQVDPKIGLTFAAGLRAIVEHGPDVIMVGEVRDEETASVAVEATDGCLVLSALRADDAASALSGLLDMRVEPLLLASSVKLIMAQRLVRKICLECRKSRVMGLSELRTAGVPESQAKLMLGGNPSLTVWEGAKCERCSYTGYAGRVGVFEIIEMNEEIRDSIMRRAGTEEIEAEARRQGMTAMFEDGIGKVLAGQTTVEELLRVMRA